MTRVLLEKPTYVYFLYDAAGRLLYIGCSHNLRSRRSSHIAESRWWPRVHRHRLVGPFASRQTALAFERDAIRRYQPPFNVQHTVRAPAVGQ